MDNQKLYRSQAGYKEMMAHYDQALSQGATAYETRFVETRFGQTHVVTGGPKDAPPILLFHGWNGNASGAGDEFPFLFATYRVYMPDIIGHTGKSAPVRLSTQGADYAHWAYDVLSALSLEKVHVMGISGGGWMTLKFCAYYSNCVEKAVALSSDGLTKANMLGIISWMLPAVIMPNPYTAKRFMRFMRSSKHTNDSELEDFAHFLRLLKQFKTQGNPGLLSDQELGNISAPLLVLMGEEERIFPPNQAVARAQRCIPSLVTAEIVPNAGHMMGFDQPDFLAKRVLHFLSTEE
jgi:pimeloyl-ACP methyl ester carboxylesterase